MRRRIEFRLAAATLVAARCVAYASAKHAQAPLRQIGGIIPAQEVFPIARSALFRFGAIHITMDRAGGFSPGIQYLRAVAALAVLLYHVLSHWLPRYEPHYMVLSAGVDIFFVVSGFVMWSVTVGREGGSWSFFSKRLKRIVPLYWAITTGMLAIMLAIPSVLRNSRFDVAHIVASYMFIPWPHPVKRTFEPLLFPGWTLNYEMMFYTIFALALFAPMRFRLPTVVGALVGLVALGLVPHAATSPLEFWTSPIVLEFAMGTCLGAAVTAKRRAPVPVSVTAIVVGLCLLVATGITGIYSARVLIWGIPAALVVSGCVFLEREIGSWLVPLPLFLGDASYSIYLAHVPIVSAAFQVWNKTHALHNPAGITVTMLITALVSTGSGALLYLFAERPMIRHFKVPTPESRARIAINSNSIIQAAKVSPVAITSKNNR